MFIEFYFRSHKDSYNQAKCPLKNVLLLLFSMNIKMSLHSFFILCVSLCIYGLKSVSSMWTMLFLSSNVALAVEEKYSCCLAY